MKLLGRHSSFLAATFACLTTMLEGCSGAPVPCSTPADIISLLAYPAQDSNGVPASLRTLILSMPAEPVQLLVAGASSGVPIETTPTALPSPFPSPLTPQLASNPPSSFFAVSIPALEPGTTYHVQARETVYTCTSSSKRYVSSGSFSTR